MNRNFRCWCFACLCAVVLAFTGCAQEDPATSENSGSQSSGSCPNCCDTPSRNAVNVNQGEEADCCKEVTPSHPTTTPAVPPVTTQSGEGAKVETPAP